MGIRSSEITPRSLYIRRREFLAVGAAGAGALLLPRAVLAAAEAPHGRKLEGVKPGQPSTDEKKNSLEEITHYNNFYEFGTDKDDPARHASKLQTRPWTVKVEGECAKPGTFDIDELLKFPLQERVYRLRCVEAWKYGFKSGKSLVKIRLQETQPPTTWSQYAGGTEYGFYANVNPEVDHPRWSQAKERRIGELFRRPTLKFNGYGDQVAKLYAGMDLRKFF